MNNKKDKMIHINPELIDPQRNMSMQVSRIVDTLVEEGLLDKQIGRVLFEEWVVMERFDESVGNEASKWLAAGQPAFDN